MLANEDMDYIRIKVEEYWKAEIKTAEFTKIASGKEIGHKIGDMVDEKTTSLLKSDGRFLIAHEQRNGNTASRSMGDFWLASGGIYHPINIKAGEFGKNGQPNLVSLKRVISALSDCVIDSYYLLIMKIEHNQHHYIPHVYFVDMLDFLDYTAFNSGPGQMMLKEAQFYPEVDKLYSSGQYFKLPRKSVPEKISKLYEMLDRADKQLIIDRERKRNQIREQVARYGQSGKKTVLMQAQEEYFNIG